MCRHVHTLLMYRQLYTPHANHLSTPIPTQSGRLKQRVSGRAAAMDVEPRKTLSLPLSLSLSFALSLSFSLALSISLSLSLSCSLPPGPSPPFSLSLLSFSLSLALFRRLEVSSDESRNRQEHYRVIPAHRNWQIETAVWNLAGFLHCALETR